MAFLLFVAVILLLPLGFPVAFTLAGVSLLFALASSLFGVFDLELLRLIPSRIFGALQNEILVAVPLFILMGSLLSRSGLAERLVAAFAHIFRNVPSGGMVAVVILGGVLAASTGIVGATVTTMGLMVLPQLLKMNYSKTLACGTICASGTLGQIIPPSIVLVLLGDVMSTAYQQAQSDQGIFSYTPVSIADLFAGALVPGILTMVFYMTYIVVHGVRTKSEHRQVQDRPAAEEQWGFAKVFFSLVPVLLLVFLVLGSILLGAATPTEASSLGAVGAFLLWVFSPEKVTVHCLLKTAEEAVRVSAAIFMILIGSTIFALVFRGLGGDDAVAAFFDWLPNDTALVLLVVMVTMFFLGFVLEFIEIIFIIVPVIAPVLLGMGIDPIWLGVMFALNLQTSFLTPPLGFALFYLRSVAPASVQTKDIYLGALPFVFLQIAVILAVASIPGLATWLPAQIFQK